MTRLSIIVPTLNEGASIRAALASLRRLRTAGHEVIMVDGGSRDETLERASPLADRVLATTAGRAHQMNAGARAASGDVLLFLHSDTLLPAAADHAIIKGLQHGRKQWGRFDVRLAGGHPMLRLIERMMNWRSRATGIATGDQAMFIYRRTFEQAGGFPEIALMEDIELSRRLKKTAGRPLCLKQRAITSSRRWERDGMARTVVRMWGLRAAYFLGASPERLARAYYRQR